MIYFVGALIPLVLQSLLVYIVIEMNTGNGSWVGLGALLIGMFAIPATAIANVIYMRTHDKLGAIAVIARCFGIASLMPLLVLLLLLFT